MMAPKSALVSPPPFLGTFVGRADETIEIGRLLAMGALKPVTSESLAW